MTRCKRGDPTPHPSFSDRQLRAPQTICKRSIRNLAKRLTGPINVVHALSYTRHRTQIKVQVIIFEGALLDSNQKKVPGHNF